MTVIDPIPPAPAQQRYPRQRYLSPAMQERRRRILAQARALLAEGGEASFNIRELSRRAGVSSRTLYHAFGGREGILAHAIAEHIEQLGEGWASQHRGNDLDSVLAEYDAVAVEVERNAAYITTLVALFFSPAPIAEAIASIRALPADRIRRWLAAAPRRALLPGFEERRIVEQHVHNELVTYRRWTLGEIALRDLADELRLGFLATLLTVTTGTMRTGIAARHARLCATVAGRG